VGFKNSKDADVQGRKYMRSFALIKDMLGFNILKISSVESYNMYDQKIVKNSRAGISRL